MKYPLFPINQPTDAGLIYTACGHNDEFRREQPDSISGLCAWYRSDDVVLSGSTVVQWNDRSGNAYHATSPTETQRPTYVFVDNPLGSQPCLVGDGVNDVMVTPSIIQINDVAAITTFCVQYKTTATVGRLKIIWNLVETSGSTNLSLDANYFYNTDNPTGLSFNFGSHPLPGLSSVAKIDVIPTITTPFVSTTVWDRSGTTQATRFIPYINGTVNTVTSVADFDYTKKSFSSTPLHIFGRASNAVFACPARFAEMIIYNRVLTTAERQSVERYLGSRYGISVSS